MGYYEDIVFDEKVYVIQNLKLKLNEFFFNEKKDSLMKQIYKDVVRLCKNNSDYNHYYIGIMNYLKSQKFKDDTLNVLKKELIILFSKPENISLNVNSNDINDIVIFSKDNYFEPFRKNIIETINSGLNQQTIYKMQIEAYVSSILKK